MSKIKEINEQEFEKRSKKDFDDFNKRVNNEEKRLLAIFEDIDKNKLDFCEKLIKRLSWLTVSVEDLEESIAREGQKTFYDNGGGQCGWRVNPDVNTLIAYNKSITTMMKQMSELVPTETKGSKLGQFMDDEDSNNE